MPNYYVEGVKGVVILQPEQIEQVNDAGYKIKPADSNANKIYCSKHKKFYDWYSGCKRCEKQNPIKAGTCELCQKRPCKYDHKTTSLCVKCMCAQCTDVLINKKNKE